MYLKHDILNITIGRVTFESSAEAAGVPAFVLDPDAIIGWTDGVSIKREITPRALAWGDFPERGYMTSRTITLTGTAIATSPQELHFMRDVLAGLLIHGEFEEMEVRNLSGSRFAWVSLAGPLNWIQKSDNIASWKMELYADDPRIYGLEQSLRISDSSVVGGLKYPVRYPINYNAGRLASGTIKNNGNSDMYIKAVVTGDFYSGFSIENGRGKVVTYTGIVTTNSPVTIDMMKQTASQSGMDRSTFLQTRGFFTVAPDETIAPKFTPRLAGAGWCDVMYRDTWI